MKKTYIQPLTEMVSTFTDMAVLLTASGVSSNNGITYGGVDEDGSLEPSSRRYSNGNQQNLWEDDDLED